MVGNTVRDYMVYSRDQQTFSGKCQIVLNILDFAGQEAKSRMFCKRRENQFPQSFIGEL